ncbi:AT-hook motif nuclear-localized protein 10-like [Cucurbita maxima]|uniref:AT-hook motif nuclear-localized protein n=1 Tax=Cucurbita maxima TaxID=3661 RepID=A0A6J1KLN9_CUCMA|nr:AT-hook motif nuclear-localized protein 10-like [Cucurbita maxima]XP_023002577.1 AT-hook motif nuclear-localized protein 10-like [Cucurbita maxima]
MSGSETGVVTSREPFSIGVQNSSLQSQAAAQNMRLTFSADGTAAYKPVTPSTSPAYQSSMVGVSGNDGIEGSAGGGSILPHGFNINSVGSEQTKKKRGRPRKYGPDGSMALALGSGPPSGSGGFSPSTMANPASEGLASPNSMKKTKGRPHGSKKKQQLEALGPAGIGFTPHVIDVKAGEDVSSKIMSFSQNGPRAICILSANGAISNVTLRQSAISGGTVTYEGRFEILSLSGSFLLSENGGQRSRTGGLSVSLSGPDGRVLGGGVAGLLTAASPVQVVVGSFVVDSNKEPKSDSQTEPVFASQMPNPVGFGHLTGGGGGGGASSPSHGTPSESSSGDPDSPLNNSSGARDDNNNNHPQGMSGMPWK